jgi:hypothetical protein
MESNRLVHEELRKVLNADRRRQFAGSGRGIALLCECGSPTCHKTVILTPEEYDTDPGPILHPDHAEAQRRGEN